MRPSSRAALLGLAMVIVPCERSHGQAHMIDVSVRTGKGSAPMEFVLIAPRHSIVSRDTQPLPDRPGASLDTLRLRTPQLFSLDIRRGQILLISPNGEWLTADVLLVNGGQISATSDKLKIELLANKRVLVGGFR